MVFLLLKKDKYVKRKNTHGNQSNLFFKMNDLFASSLYVLAIYAKYIYERHY